MQLTPYLKTWSHPHKPGRTILLATRRCALLELSDSMWQRITSGASLTEQEQATLTRLGVLVTDRETEKQALLHTFDNQNATSRRFEVTAVLTLECNLACPYCFEEPFRGNLVMTKATADLLVAGLIEQMVAGLDVLVDFYGGEALIRLDLLLDIARRLQEAATQHGVSFTFNLFSNGVLLTRPNVEKLLPLGLQAVRTTLDGPPDIHNQQRPFVSGKDSFDLILANLAAVHDILPLKIGGNYTRNNYTRFPEMLDHLLEAGIDPAKLRDVSFSPVMPKADGSGLGDHATTCACTAEPWAIEAHLFLRQEIIRRGFPTEKIGPGACMIEFEKDWVVNYNGDIYKCPVFMGDESMRIGSLTNGVGDYHASHRLDIWKNDECLDCAYLPICFGGCRFFRKLQTGAIDGVDCRKAMLDASLERLVLQDLAARKPAC